MFVTLLLTKIECYFQNANFCFIMIFQNLLVFIFKFSFNSAIPRVLAVLSQQSRSDAVQH